MKRTVLVVLLAAGIACKGAAPAPAVSPEVSAWQARAEGVTIVRDDWGIPHISGKTDADAVFGLMYAQAEDDFNRVETNFINAMGRLAEAEGEKEIYRDLRMKLFIDPVELQAEYQKAPAWLQGADGRLGRRVELLPAHASAGEAAGHHQVRTVDGAQLQRRQHRRRHRAGLDRAARGVLREEPGRVDPRRARSALPGRAARTHRLQWHRHRPGQHHGRQGPAAGSTRTPRSTSARKRRSPARKG